MKTRREFLKLSAFGLSTLPFRRDELAVGIEHYASGPSPQGAQAPTVNPEGITPYIDPLPIIKRRRGARGITELVMRMTEFRQKLHSQLPATTVWGYEESYPGPIIEAERGEAVSVRWENHLPQRHLFTVDEGVHGAMPPAPAVRTVPHLHGAQTQSAYDGLPEAWFISGKAATYRYPNQQRAAMLWYHDHALGITRLNNYAGLSGVYLLRDREERSLNLPAGDFEIPLVLQDRTLDYHAQLVYSPTEMSGMPTENGKWGPEFFGRLPVVNGAIYPVLEVEACLYRFRVLNAANSRFFRIFLSSPTLTFPTLALPFRLIGTDGGLLAAPIPIPPLLLAPGERADLLADFTGREGQEFILANNAPAPFPGSKGEGAASANALPELMKIKVSRGAGPRKTQSTVKRTYSLPFEQLRRQSAVMARDFVLTEALDQNQRSLGLKINGLGYSAPVTEQPRMNSTEIWRFVNATDDTHPIHIHHVQFQILERVSFDPQSYLTDKTIKSTGSVRPPDEEERGWKDTVRVDPNDVLSVIIRFTGYPGKYVYHCHMLEHEDNDMMRPFEIIR